MPGLEPSIALAAFAEAAAVGRRVLVIGNALGGLPDQLLERGARFVHVCDVDPLRVAQASARNRAPNVSFGPLADGQVALQSGAFELAIVENLGAADAVSVVRRVRRSLAPRGAALFACPNPEARLPLLGVPDPGAIALDYYALYDAVAADFPVVRMLGQAPFVGYAIADFAPNGEPEPALDSAFVPGGAEEPDWFIALASQHPLELEQFYVVQLPTRSVLSDPSGAASSEALRRARDEERTLRQRIVELERKLKSAGSAGQPAANPALERELTRQNARIAELEARAATADERADRAEVELEEHRAQSDRELSALRESEAELRKKLSEAGAPSDADREAEIAAFEAQLAERGEELRRLERELRDTERVGRDLAQRLAEQARPSRDELDRVAADRALDEANLLAAGWAVEALADRLEQATGKRESADPDSEATRAELQQRAVLATQIAGSR